MWWERFGASRNVVLPRFFLPHRLGRPLERSEIAWGCLWVRLGCARGQTKSLLIEIHGFLPFSARRCALVPIPVHPPDLSRPLRGPYESPRPNPRVQANDGANPYGGCRPRRLPDTLPNTPSPRAGTDNYTSPYHYGASSAQTPCCVRRGDGVRVVGFGAARTPSRRHVTRVAAAA